MSVTSLIELVGTFFYIIILARVILTWFPQISRYNPVVQIIYTVTEPILRPIRRFMPRSIPVDLSPMIAILLISGVQWLLALLLRGI